MPIAKVQLPDGRIAKLEVDASVTPEQIEAFVAANLKMFDAKTPGPGPAPTPTRPDPYTELARETGGFEAFGASVGRGAAKILRGLGLMEPESEAERKAFEALGKEYPKTTLAGEITGEAAPFAVAPIGAIPGTAARVAAAAGLGALEGGLIARGEQKSEAEQVGSGILGGTVAGGVEAAVPVVGRLGGALFRKVTGRTPRSTLVTPSGQPTQELTAALESQGLTFDDLTEAAVSITQQAPRGAQAEQVARQAMFERAGFPATRGDITKAFPQQALEERLVTSAADVAGAPIREIRVQQSRAFNDKLTGLIEQAGVSENVGGAIKSALSGRKNMLRNQKNALYRAAGKQAEDIGGVPIITDTIAAALPDARTLREISTYEGAKSEALMDLLAEFGIDQSEAAADRISRKGIDVTPLSIQNFDTFRKSLNRLMDVAPGQPNHMGVLVGPIRDALDAELSDVAKAGVKDEKLMKLMGLARKTTQQLKREFSPQAIAGRLTGVKRDGVTPIVEASQIYKNILGPSKPVELIDRTVKSLRAAGPAGKQALGDLQAATVMDLLESGFKAQSRRIEGEKVFGVVPFVKRLEQIGDDKLKRVFTGNPEGYRELKRIERVARNLIPDSGAVPKGSAAVNLDALLGLLGKIPGANLTAAVVGTVGGGAGRRMQARAAAAPRAEVERVAGLLEREFPSIMGAIGTAGLAKGDENAEGNRGL